jgi:hypothetical protein
MRLTVCALVVAAALPLLAEDLTILSKVTRDGGAPQTTASYISSDHIRMSLPIIGQEMILTIASGDITMLDPAKKTYFIMTRQDMEAMKAKIQEPMKKAEEVMKDLPPDQKAEWEATIEGMVTITVEKSGTSRTIAGYDCDNWTVSFKDFTKSEQCMTTQLKFPAAAWEAYKGLTDPMQATMAAMGPTSAGAAKMQEQFEKMKGFPLANTTTIMPEPKIVIATEVTSVKYGPIPASVFEIPAGYKKIDNPITKAMERLEKRP